MDKKSTKYTILLVQIELDKKTKTTDITAAYLESLKDIYKKDPSTYEKIKQVAMDVFEKVEKVEVKSENEETRADR
jgi:hypothetical protein